MQLHTDCMKDKHIFQELKPTELAYQWNRALKTDTFPGNKS